MKTRKYLHVHVTRNNGTAFLNPLMLSEVKLINKLARENHVLEVRMMEVPADRYKMLFG